MNDLRQAAQQALEALESDHPDIQLRAATALRAALAEPDYWQEEARRYAGNADYWRKRYEALAEPQTTHWEGCEAVHPECKEKNK